LGQGTSIANLVGKGSSIGSFFPVYDNPIGSHRMIGAWSNGTIELQFQHMRHPPFASASKRQKLAMRVMSTTGIKLTEEKLTKRPSFPCRIAAEGKDFRKVPRGDGLDDRESSVGSR
jgi:hypothetical protein